MLIQRSSPRNVAILVAFYAAIVGAACDGPRDREPATGRAGGVAEATSSSEDWLLLSESEEVILALGPQLHALAFAVENLELPDLRTRNSFAPSVEVLDLVSGLPDDDEFYASVGVRSASLPVSGSVTRADRESIALWRPLLESVAWFENAAFQIVTGGFAEGSRDRFEAEVGFNGLARMQDGASAAFAIRQSVRWRRAGDGWEITAWRSHAPRLLIAAGPLFEDVLPRMLSDPRQRRIARTSVHDGLVLDYIQRSAAGGSGVPKHPFFTVAAQDRHPGVAVVDWDRDGFDDVYLMSRWGRNQFFHNQADGHFVERAASLGLDLRAHSTSAVFADFDNDGDDDLFLGRSLLPSAYLENTGERYVDRSAEAASAPLPSLVSSVSAVDFDRDGLLDVFVSTYASRILEVLVSAANARRRDGSLDPSDPFAGLPSPFTPEEARELYALESLPSRHAILDAAGPRNVLLRNVGEGRFVRHPAPVLEAFRNTYQTTWADYDGDGDPDAYLANDFGPDVLARNDGEAGFTDVTGEIRGAQLGLGMGASFGDYDLDGRQDLYVTNMYSKAGRRVTSTLGRVDRRFAEIASGNYLYHNTPTGLARVSGGSEGLSVEHAGWGFGSVFADVDNDRYPDLLALSGYYSAPPAVATLVDT